MNAHLEIARERFLDLIADGVDARAAAIAAIECADVFDAEYSKRWIKPTETLGCKSCFGSGGKRNNPCKVCGGTGKVTK